VDVAYRATPRCCVQGSDNAVVTSNAKPVVGTRIAEPPPGMGLPGLAVRGAEQLHQSLACATKGTQSKNMQKRSIKCWTHAGAVVLVSVSVGGESPTIAILPPAPPVGVPPAAEQNALQLLPEASCAAGRQQTTRDILRDADGTIGALVCFCIPMLDSLLQSNRKPLLLLGL